MILLDRRAASLAASSGATVLLAGFGVLNVFYLTIETPPHLPGLFDFVSAAWGDSIALPIMTTTLVYAVLILPPAQQERIFATVAGIIGGVIGGATQVQWLRDDTPRLNWTFPRPHHFNAAGQYHAAFLITMCALTGALWVLTLLRLAIAARVGRGTIIAVLIAAGAGATFAALLAVDAQAATTTTGHATAPATGVGVFSLLVGLTISAVSRRSSRRHTTPTI